MSRRPALDALVKQRDELQEQHAAAVAKLEGELAADVDGFRTVINRREVNRLYDEFSDVQARIDEQLAKARVG